MKLGLIGLKASLLNGDPLRNFQYMDNSDYWKNDREYIIFPVLLNGGSCFDNDNTIADILKNNFKDLTEYFSYYYYKISRIDDLFIELKEIKR